MSSEEEVVAEVEAMEAMYGDDCKVISRFPPNLQVRLQPRTGGVCTEQFVEATIGFRATSKYPDEPPVITVIYSKGLDDQREHEQLISRIKEKALQLSAVGMIIELCEEAVEKLSEMNYPDGDCPMCLCPLCGDGDEDGTPAPPFMKLMSCFHCFHSECILTWYNWLKAKELRREVYVKRRGRKEIKGTCPICRKVFYLKDLEHVIDVVGVLPDRASMEKKISGEMQQLSLNAATSSNVPSGSSTVPSGSSNVPSVSSNVPTGSSTAASVSSTAASVSSNVPSVSSNVPTGSSNVPTGSSNVPSRSSSNTNRAAGIRRFRHAPARQF